MNGPVPVTPNLRYMIWLLVIFGICWLVGKVRNQPVNGGKWAFLILLAIFIAETAITCTAMSQNPDLTPFEQGRGVGHVTGNALPALVIAGVLWWWLSRRQRSQPPPLPELTDWRTERLKNRPPGQR